MIFLIVYFDLKHCKIVEKYTVLNSQTFTNINHAIQSQPDVKIKYISPEFSALVSFLSFNFLANKDVFLSLHLLSQKYQFLLSLSMFRTQASFILSNTFEYCKCILPVVREWATLPSQIHKFCA